MDGAWWPGYLYARDWRKDLAGHWQCFVHYVATDPPDPTGRATTRAGYFNDTTSARSATKLDLTFALRLDWTAATRQ